MAVSFKGAHCPQDIILTGVRWYVAYPLSYRHVEALMEERGVSAEKLDTIHAPMGLELNAETPEEIAVSILAEITMLRRQGTGQPMSPAEMKITGGESSRAPA